MTTLATLTTPMTATDAETAIYSALAARGVATTTWKSGGVVRTIISALAIVIAALSSLQAMIANAGFLDLASGDWLTLLAKYFYETDRNTGTFAAGSITLNNSGGGVYSGNPGDLIVSNPTTGKVYRNTAAFSIAALQTGVIVPVSASEIGSASSSGAATITNMVTTLLGVTCTNAAAFVGIDAEADETLRARCRAKWSTLGTGSTSPAYDYWSRAASTEVVRTSIREHDNLGTPTSGHVTVILATSSAGVSAAAVTAVATYIETKRPLCATVHVAAATTLAIPVTATITARAGFGAAAVTAAQANLAVLASSLRIGETVYLNAIIEQLMLPAGVVNVTLTAPTTDTALTYGQVPAFTPTLSYTEIP